MRTVTALLIAASCAFAQNWQPDVANARFESRPFSGDLAAQFHSGAPTWFGYAVKAVPGDRGNQCHCRLEGGWENDGDSGPVHLEAPSAVAVLFRVTGNVVGKVQVHPLSCQLDAGGMPFVSLTGVPAEASIAFLEKLVRSDDVLDGAILAISLHDDPRADAVLERLTRPAQPEKVREKVVFWLGASRGARGVEVLGNLRANDPSEHIRDKAVFALFIDKQPEALALLMQAAKSDPSGHVRGQALFWLAQRAGQRASATIVDAIRNDPDTEVKKRAVFALSQLPKDEGVPKLIDVARNQRNPEVRKQAFFWLGQSRDPRALQFIEQALTSISQSGIITVDANHSEY
jgi:HEAT repeat protein